MYSMGGLTAPPAVDPRYMAIYDLSPDKQVERRMAVTVGNRKISAPERQKLTDIIGIISAYMNANNPFVKLLRTRAELAAANANKDPQPQFNVSHLP